MNGIMFQKNYVDANHAIVAKRFANEVNNLIQRKEKKRQSTTQKQKCVCEICLKKNCCERFLQKNECAIKKKPWKLMFFNCEKINSINFLENIYLINPLASHLCPRINFPSKK